MAQPPLFPASLPPQVPFHSTITLPPDFSFGFPPLALFAHAPLSFHPRLFLCAFPTFAPLHPTTRFSFDINLFDHVITMSAGTAAALAASAASFEAKLHEAVQACLAAKPASPLAFLSAWLADAAASEGAHPTVARLIPRQILDSRGMPTIQIDVYCLDPGQGHVVFIARDNVPSGASTGSHEAAELRDGDPKVYFKKGVLKAMANIRGPLTGAVVGKDVTDLLALDRALVAADGTEYKTNLGGNAITAASQALARAGAVAERKQLYLFLAGHFTKVTSKRPTLRLPQIMSNVINGGKHASGGLIIQEFMLVPTAKVAYSLRLRWVSEVYQALKALLKARFGGAAVHLGDEGGFAPPINTADETLSILTEAVTAVGLRVGVDIFFAIDSAASEFYDSETKKYQIEKGQWLTTAELVDYYEELVGKHPSLTTIEDGFDEMDYEGWRALTARLGDRIMIIGDDVYTSNPTFIRRGIAEGWANSLLLKVNQIGTVTEAMESAPAPV